MLARAGIASRRSAEALITAGRVRVDGRVAVLGQRVTADADVRVDGRPLTLRSAHRTFMLHKPAGVITSAADERGRATVMGLVPRVPGLHPVGRLDLDSEGLLLLTTDGALTLRMTHPRYGHPKTYRVWCSTGTLGAAALALLRGGVVLDDGPARGELVRAAPGGAIIVLREGRKRQVRRMFAAVGAQVERLLRTHVGRLPLGTLAARAWRELGAADLELLGYTPDGAPEERREGTR